MDYKDLIKLLDAGFTKDDIMQLINANRDTESSAPAPAAAPEPAAPATDASRPEPEAPRAEPDIASLISNAIDAKFKEMQEQFKMPAMPSIGNIKPLGIDDVIRNFFKEE